MFKLIKAIILRSYSYLKLLIDWECQSSQSSFLSPSSISIFFQSHLNKAMLNYVPHPSLSYHCCCLNHLLNILLAPDPHHRQEVFKVNILLHFISPLHLAGGKFWTDFGTCTQGQLCWNRDSDIYIYFCNILHMNIWFLKKI